MPDMTVQWGTFDLVPMCQKILALQDTMAELPQVDMEARTTNIFHGGMLYRKVDCPEGVVFVGKKHKTDHFFIVLSGVLELACDNSVQYLQGPCMVPVRAGTKKAARALTDCVFATMHVCAATSVEAAEDELIEPETMRLFDAYNKPIREVIT